MALEDLAMFRAIPTCTVFYPSDGVSAERAIELAANTKVRLVLFNTNFSSILLKLGNLNTCSSGVKVLGSPICSANFIDTYFFEFHMLLNILDLQTLFLFVHQ